MYQDDTEMNATVREGRTHNDALALSSSAQLSVSRVLHVHNPTTHKYSKPREKEILHSSVGQTSLRGKKRKVNINLGRELQHSPC